MERMERKKEKRAPRNTAREAQSNPGGFILEAMALGGDNAILRQESEGQRSFVKSDTLPTDIGYDRDRAKSILEVAGIRFLGVIEGDPIFQYVELPSGWKKEATDHSMWSKLVDEKGRERALIFYKAAFYDRSAHMSLTCRYSISVDYERVNKENICVANVKDCGNVIHTIKFNSKEGRWMSEKIRDIANKWLDEKYPDWRNPGAYWD